MQYLADPKQVAHAKLQDSHKPLEEYVPGAQSVTHFPFDKTALTSQLVQILGWVEHVLHGELQGTHLPEDCSIILPAGQVE